MRGLGQQDTFETSYARPSREVFTSLCALGGAALFAAAGSALSGGPAHALTIAESAIAGTGAGALALGAVGAAVGLATAPDSHTSGLSGLSFGILAGAAGGLAGLVAGTVAGANGLIGGPVVAALAGAAVASVAALYASQ